MSFYLTTPIYYVNSTPHIGHAYTTIAADILARHHRQRGEETFFLTGTDENGSKVAQAAAAAGSEPQEFVERMSERFREMTARVGAAPDAFIRTTEEGHRRCVQEFLEKIRANSPDDVFEGSYSGLYCTACEAFYSEADLVEGRCPQHGTVPEWVEEKNWFFRLSAYQEKLLDLYRADPDYVLPHFRANEARSFIERGLDDISISRGHQTWGIPVPWDEGQIVYVWVDALINYWSATRYKDGAEGLWPARHLLAKDILKFHCIIWPALLLAAGEEPPKQLFVHGYLLFGDRKMSKSLGNVIDPLDLIDVYGVDPVRFYLMRAATFGQDGNVSIDGVHERYERELGNDLGNLLSRTTAMIARYRDGSVIRADDEEGQSWEIRGRTADFHYQLEDLHTSVRGLLDRFEITTALDLVWEAVRALNRLVEQTAPWTLAKDEGRTADLDVVLYTLADGLRSIAVALAAFVPDTSTAILSALRQTGDVKWDRVRPRLMPTTTGLEAAPPLFPRVEAPGADAA